MGGEGVNNFEISLFTMFTYSKKVHNIFVGIRVWSGVELYYF